MSRRVHLSISWVLVVLLPSGFRFGGLHLPRARAPSSPSLHPVCTTINGSICAIVDGSIRAIVDGCMARHPPWLLLRNPSPCTPWLGLLKLPSGLPMRWPYLMPRVFGFLCTRVPARQTQGYLYCLLGFLILIYHVQASHDLSRSRVAVVLQVLVGFKNSRLRVVWQSHFPPGVQWWWQRWWWWWWRRRWWPS